MLTEPLIYSSRKGQQSPNKTLRRGSTKGYIKRTNSKATLNKSRTRSESAKSTTKAESKTMITRKRFEREIEKTKGARTRSRGRGQMEEEEKQKDQSKKEENNIEDEEEGKKVVKKLTKSRRGQHLRKGVKQKDIIVEKPKELERDLELEEILQDVDVNEDDGGFDMIEDSIETGESQRTKSYKVKNAKRLAYRENELHSPKCSILQLLNE